MKLEYNYHTHTYRCGHAYGTDEEYVLTAIKLGIKRLGFSDHIFLKEIDVRKGTVEEYIDSIRYLKEKYKDQIDIIIGFEAEYFECYKDYYKELLDTKKIDYLIQGQHFDLINGEMVGYYNNPYKYLDDVIKGMNSGLYSYLAHPDIFIMWMPDIDRKVLEDVSIKIIKEAIKLDMPLELNLYGIIKKGWNNGEKYPSNLFFELCKKYNPKIVLGVDAHDPSHFNVDTINKAFEFAKKHKLNVITNYSIKNIIYKINKI